MHDNDNDVAVDDEDDGGGGGGGDIVENVVKNAENQIELKTDGNIIDQMISWE